MTSARPWSPSPGPAPASPPAARSRCWTTRPSPWNLLLALPPGTPDAAALVGRLVAFLRARTGPATPGTATSRAVTLADAVAEYEAGAFRRLKHNTARTYRTWLRRVVAAHSDRLVADISTGDLADLIARHVADARDAAKAAGTRTSGRSGEITAVTALRHLWRYLHAKGYAPADVAAALVKPPKPRTSRRRGYRHDEAALMRHLARSGRVDPLLDEMVIALAERALLRKEETTTLRICDVDLDAMLLYIYGKDDESRVVPITPGLGALLRRYLTDRRPAHIPAEQWERSTEKLLRRRPTACHPNGRPSGRRRIETMFDRFHRAAPALFADGMLCLHSYRHSGAKYLELHYGRAMARAGLGHLSRTSPTDHYVNVEPDELRAALTDFERHLREAPADTEQPGTVAAA